MFGIFCWIQIQHSLRILAEFMKSQNYGNPAAKSRTNSESTSISKKMSICSLDNF